MSASSDDRSKNELLDALARAEVSAGALQRRLKEMSETAGFAQGLAQRFRPVVQQLPGDHALPSDVWRDLTSAWEAQDRSASSMFSIVGADLSSAATTAAVTLTTTASTQILGNAWIKKSEDLGALRSFLHRPSLLQQVRSSAYEFGLSQAGTGSRSAIQLLIEASEAQSQSSLANPAVTGVLIPAREAILTALADLLRRRPQQEPAGKASAKVESIGRQCGRSGLAPDHFDRLGRDLERLLDRLSEAKSRALSSSQVSDLFDEVLQFFVAFLGSLNPAALASR